MRRREFLKTVGLGAAALGAPGWLRSARAAPAAGPGRPNIIFILSDDYGIDGVGCYGSDKYKTPNLDALARTGLRFETCYSAPLCGPTRCEFTTGRYAFRTGGLTNQSAGRPSSRDETGIAKVLKQAGYATCESGKWRQMGETPADWGFDEYLTDPTAGGYYWVKSYTKNGQLVTTDKEIYEPDVLQQFAIDFITRHKDGPFFLYYPMHFVHGAIVRTPDSKPEEKAALYADNISYMDKQVGQLMAELDRLNLREKTVVLFSGDNGTAGHSGTIGGREVHGAKGSMWEGGARVPLIASWKGTAPEGKVLKDMVDFSDLFPTFAELAGAKLPEGVTIDGHSFAPQLRGEPGTPRKWIFVQLGGAWYVREPLWKLTGKGELYDMKDAPFVETPVPADAENAEATAARKRLQAVLDGINPAGGKTEPARADKAGAPAPKKGKKKQNAP
jgi:arylsulfatase A